MSKLENTLETRTNYQTKMSSRYRTNDSSHGKEGSRERSRSPPAQRPKFKDETVDKNHDDNDNNSRKPPENVSLDAKKRLKNIGIQMKLTSTQKQLSQNKPKMTVAAAFNQDSDDEPEEMPPEARMRMRNIGRDTPTSSGPNSFGKTKQGFSDSKKVFERNLREAIENSSEQD